MTDARFPDRWMYDLRLQTLPTEHKWSFMMALAWSVHNRTDGLIKYEHLSLIPDFTPGAEKALVGAGLWVTTRSRAWQITDFAETQTSRAELQAQDERRTKARVKKANQREAERQAQKASELASLKSENAPVPGDTPGDVPGDVSANSSRTRPRTRPPLSGERSGSVYGADQSGGAAVHLAVVQPPLDDEPPGGADVCNACGETPATDGLYCVACSDDLLATESESAAP
jgi:hypothetical protein